jgi:asparagine synthase (glutamine-hydrolysing)
MPKIEHQPKCESIYLSVAQAMGQSVKRNLTEGLLLSGGLDTSILAGVAASWQKLECITVALQGAPAPDIKYAKQVAQLFQLKQTIHYFGEEELEDGLRNTIKVLKTFDPMEVRNSTAAYIALKIAREQGLKSVMTGDGGDELWGGYSFFFDMTPEQRDKALTNLWQNMTFSSIPLGQSLGIQVRLPFLDPEFKAFAMNLDSAWKVKSENGQVYGKWVLRKAFENLLTPDLAWRIKAPLEVGTGTTTLPSFFASRISDAEFARKRYQYQNENKVRLRSKEHLHYYEIYLGEIRPESSGTGISRRCPDCGASVPEPTNFCRTCGAYPV